MDDTSYTDSPDQDLGKEEQSKKYVKRNTKCDLSVILDLGDTSYTGSPEQDRGKEKQNKKDKKLSQRYVLHQDTSCIPSFHYLTRRIVPSTPKPEPIEKIYVKSDLNVIPKMDDTSYTDSPDQDLGKEEQSKKYVKRNTRFNLDEDNEMKRECDPDRRIVVKQDTSFIPAFDFSKIRFAPRTPDPEPIEKINITSDIEDTLEQKEVDEERIKKLTKADVNEEMAETDASGHHDSVDDNSSALEDYNSSQDEAEEVAKADAVGQIHLGPDQKEMAEKTDQTYIDKTEQNSEKNKTSDIEHKEVDEERIKKLTKADVNEEMAETDASGHHDSMDDDSSALEDYDSYNSSQDEAEEVAKADAVGQIHLGPDQKEMAEKTDQTYIDKTEQNSEKNKTVDIGVNKKLEKKPRGPAVDRDPGDPEKKVIYVDRSSRHTSDYDGDRDVINESDADKWYPRKIDCSKSCFRRSKSDTEIYSSCASDTDEAEEQHKMCKGCRLKRNAEQRTEYRNKVGNVRTATTDNDSSAEEALFLSNSKLYLSKIRRESEEHKTRTFDVDEVQKPGVIAVEEELINLDDNDHDDNTDFVENNYDGDCEDIDNDDDNHDDSDDDNSSISKIRQQGEMPVAQEQDCGTPFEFFVDNVPHPSKLTMFRLLPPRNEADSKTIVCNIPKTQRFDLPALRDYNLVEQHEYHEITDGYWYELYLEFYKKEMAARAAKRVGRPDRDDIDEYLEINQNEEWYNEFALKKFRICDCQYCYTFYSNDNKWTYNHKIPFVRFLLKATPWDPVEDAMVLTVSESDSSRDTWNEDIRSFNEYSYEERHREIPNFARELYTLGERIAFFLIAREAAIFHNLVDPDHMTDYSTIGDISTMSEDEVDIDHIPSCWNMSLDSLTDDDILPEHPDPASWAKQPSPKSDISNYGDDDCSSFVDSDIGLWMPDTDDDFGMQHFKDGIKIIIRNKLRRRKHFTKLPRKRHIRKKKPKVHGNRHKRIRRRRKVPKIVDEKDNKNKDMIELGDRFKAVIKSELYTVRTFHRRFRPLSRNTILSTEQDSTRK